MKENILTTVLAGSIVLIALFTGMGAFGEKESSEASLQGASFINDFPSVTTSSAVTLPVGTSTSVLSANVARQYVRITNAGSNKVYLRFSGSPATTTAGILLHASTSIEINQTALYTGAIQATTETSTSTLYVTEK